MHGVFNVCTLMSELILNTLWKHVIRVWVQVMSIVLWINGIIIIIIIILIICASDSHLHVDFSAEIILHSYNRYRLYGYLHRKTPYNESNRRTSNGTQDAVSPLRSLWALCIRVSLRGSETGIATEMRMMFRYYYRFDYSVTWLSNCGKTISWKLFTVSSLDPKLIYME